jgi:leucyl aminopeptidase (aminopeptidase T)
MNIEQKRKLIHDVFDPKQGEKVLFLIDLPHGSIIDSPVWKERRMMAQEWYEIFKEMGKKEKFSIEMVSYPATGMNNALLQDEIFRFIQKSNLTIAMTEFSASSTLALVCKRNNTIARCVSMPGVERRMEDTAFQADYIKVRQYAQALEKMLNDADGAEVSFSTGDFLFIDLRNRVAEADTGECRKAGQMINFPSGEACIAPYEAIPDEVNVFGESKTNGILPVRYNEELVKYVVKHNRIEEVKGKGKTAENMRIFFDENNTRRNIAELGVGCNPNAVVTGNILEDEKVPGLHIAYGMSIHLGGKVKSDMHQDICYPKDAPIEATSLNLVNKKGMKTELIRNAQLQFKLFR